jgi:type IV pilus assembly protein PilY1
VAWCDAVTRAARLALFLAAWVLAPGAAASSDEAWLQRATTTPGTVPLLAILVDTSAAMAATVEAPLPYDPARDYSPAHPGAPCRPDRIYWRRGPGPAPGCDSTRWISRGAGDAARGWRCAAGDQALDRTGVFVATRAAQWQPRAGGGYWRALRPGDDGAVECRGDRGRHGATPGAWFAADGPAGPWRADDAGEPSWDAPPLADAYVFFTGNYLNHLAAGESAPVTRYAWLAQRVAAAAQSVDGVELAILRLSHDGLGGDDDGRGGMVALAPAALPGAAGPVSTALQGWRPDGPAPLAEALSEGLRWLAGDAVHFGLDAHAAPGESAPSAAAARLGTDPDRYLSPFTHACRAVLLGIATAGARSADEGAGAALAGLPGGDPTGVDCDGDCLAAAVARLVAGDLRATLAGAQRVAVRFLLPQGADGALRAAVANSRFGPLDLDDPLAVIALLAHALQHDAAVGAGQRLSAAGLEYAPFAVADSAVYYGLSAAVTFPRWPGNLRRYRLSAAGGPNEGGRVLDRHDVAAFDAGTGLPTPTSWSEWSDQADGGDVAHGGGAGRLPPPGARRVFTDLVPAPLGDPANRVASDNPLLTREALGLAADDPRGAGNIVAWALGHDAFDQDADGDRDEARPALGDPGLAAPRVLRYAPGGPARAFVASQDGLLHAVDADTGREAWAYLPKLLLPRLAGLVAEYPGVARRHGIDGPLTLAWYDDDHDGRIVTADGDRAWLLAGLGRSGTGYFALDVSAPDDPRLLWTLSADELPGFAQSWAVPVIGRMRHTDGTRRRVVFLAGGFDPAEDGAFVPSRSLGAGLAVVDLETGELLWRAGGMPGADLAVAAMTRSAPSAPVVLDTDGDGLDDRAYLLDIGGRLLRFDFPRGAPGPDATAHLLAALGEGTEPARFFSTPDVSPTHRGGADQVALALGSGRLSRPRERAGEDSFFVVFDRLHGAPPAVTLAAQALADVTGPPFEAPPDAAGWRLGLVRHGPGEKTAGTSLTFDHRLRFVTYQPRPPAPEAPCGPPAGVNRLYTLDVRSGRPVNWIGEEPVPDEELTMAGLPPGADVAFPPAAAACDGRACARRPFALIGGHALELDFRNDPVKTSWRQLDASAP